MHLSRPASFVAAAAAIALSSAPLGAQAKLPPIVIKGTKFFYENGTQFFIKGVAYQQEVAPAGGESEAKFTDPLADEAACARDVPNLVKLGTNTIRTYAIDPTADHSACMKLLDDAGIYVVSDLSQPSLSIDRTEPTWDLGLYRRYAAVIDELAQYDNVIGFFAGNEVSNDNVTTPASAYVKAAVRDMKAYIKARRYRPMGVGYAANDDKDIRVEIAHYFNCGKPEGAIDFWGYNIYSWCQRSSMKESGYDTQVEFFRNYSVPVFFAEYGCNVPDGSEGRIWQETTALYSDQMTDVMSGGIVYMYHQEANDYGLVSVKGGKAVPLKNFERLATVIAKVDPASTSADAYEPTNQPQECPAVTDTWRVNPDSLPPTPDQELCECMWASLSCVPSEGLSTKSYSDMFDFICGEEGNLCAGIHGDAEKGVYGAYGMCNSTQQLGYVLSEYYGAQNEAATACDFEGQAVTQEDAGGGGKVSDACKAKVSAAAAINAAAATATAPVTGVDGSVDGGVQNSDDDDSLGARGAQVGTILGVMCVAMLAGAGVVLL